MRAAEETLSFVFCSVRFAFSVAPCVSPILFRSKKQKKNKETVIVDNNLSWIWMHFLSKTSCLTNETITTNQNELAGSSLIPFNGHKSIRHCLFHQVVGDTQCSIRFSLFHQMFFVTLNVLCFIYSLASLFLFFCCVENLHQTCFWFLQ